jgi:hypothetical protein
MVKDLSTSVEQTQLLPQLFFVDRFSRSHVPGIRYFLKKDEATDHARENGNLPVWSIDKNSDGGAKYFVVASYDDFWEVYQDLERPPRGSRGFAPDRSWREYESAGRDRLSRLDAEKTRARCLKEAFQILPFAYEVVLEGVPLHLYLDLEASRETNKGLDAEQLVQDLLEELKVFMCQSYLAVPNTVLLDPKLVVFDSSTSRKFSQHIIYKLNGVLFGNNYICGALMRNFHLHLIQRFGPPASNRFFVNPEASAKEKHKVCILDFAVYTKNRDFRLIGSCKRKGSSSPKTTLRWLWIQGAPGQLNKKLFLEGLIQNSCDEDVIMHIHRVVDTINDGIPSSSSLRTAQPLGPRRRGSASLSSRPSNVVQKRSVIGPTTEGLVFSRALETSLLALGKRVAQWMSRCREAPFRSFFTGKAGIKEVVLRRLRDGNYAWIIQTTSSYCALRQAKTGNGNHKVAGRKAQFLVWVTGMCKDGIYDKNKEGRVKQMCIANTCTSGMGPSRPAWSGWLGFGISRQWKQTIRVLIAPALKEEMERLQLESMQECKFVDDE